MKKEEDCIMNYGKLAKSVLLPVVGGSPVGYSPQGIQKKFMTNSRNLLLLLLPGLSPLLGPAFIRLWE